MVYYYNVFIIDVNNLRATGGKLHLRVQEACILKMNFIILLFDIVKYYTDKI